MTILSPQLEALEQEFVQARLWLEQCVARFPADHWARRPRPDHWSAAECLAHLNLTSRRFLPPIRQAVTNGPKLERPERKRFRRDFTGWLLCAVLEPPPRLRVKTPPAFVPDATPTQEALLREFGELQSSAIECVRKSSGLNLGKIRMQSIFDPRVRYNLYACFKIIAAHQRRHIWQMEQARVALESNPAWSRLIRSPR